MTSCQLLVAFHYIHTPTCFHYTLVNLFIVKSPFHHLETQDVLNNDEMPWNLLNFPMAFMVNSLFLMVTSPFFHSEKSPFFMVISRCFDGKIKVKSLEIPRVPRCRCTRSSCPSVAASPGWMPRWHWRRSALRSDQKWRTKVGWEKRGDLYGIYIGFIWDLNGSTWIIWDLYGI